MTALRRAYADAECPPRSVALVEAHGTGTPAGDEVELTALNRLMGGAGESRHVAVGSVKSQIGHTKAAAGVAGLIKAALALHHKILPPTINVDCPSAPAAQDGAVYINTTARPWIHDPGRPVRRAGVSSFGFGGVNYHAVLEEHPSPDERALHRIPRACLWHAPDPAALLSRLESGAAPDEGPVPADHARVGFVAADDAQYAALLAAAAAALRDSGEEESRRLALGRVLPPQGAAARHQGRRAVHRAGQPVREHGAAGPARRSSAARRLRHRERALPARRHPGPRGLPAARTQGRRAGPRAPEPHRLRATGDRRTRGGPVPVPARARIRPGRRARPQLRGADRAVGGRGLRRRGVHSPCASPRPGDGNTASGRIRRGGPWPPCGRRSSGWRSC
ncbi:hypothetical protein GCM10020000_73560 [Streptomyces olivoverticillatus]